ncbi:MAG: hypothetical protein ACJ75J_12690, partial [Cytophagaceae bacterium]
ISMTEKEKRIKELKTSILVSLRQGGGLYTCNHEGAENICFKDGQFGLEFDGEMGKGFYSMDEEGVIDALIRKVEFENKGKDYLGLLEIVNAKV